MTLKNLLWKSSSKGFTLIELLIVIGILGIIAVMLFINIPRQLNKGKDGKVKSDISQLRSALFIYYEDNACFPETLPACGQPLSENGNVYISEVPCDPDGNSYTYVSDGECSSSFKLYSNLRISDDPVIQQVGCTYGCGPECDYNYGLTSSNVDIAACEALPTPSPTPPGGGSTPTPTPTPPGGQTPYACAPSGACIQYVDPIASTCPRTFDNAICNNECDGRANRCKDERGKKN